MSSPATRRGVLRTLAAILGGTAAWAFLRKGRPAVVRRAFADAPPPEPGQGAAGLPPTWGMALDLAVTACQGCVIACKTENNVPIAGPEQIEKGRGSSDGPPAVDEGGIRT